MPVLIQAEVYDLIHMNLSRCHNIADLRRMAKRKLPKAMFDYIDGGADDEWTLNRNTDVFNEYSLLPEVLIDVAEIDLRTELLGSEMGLPFFLSPTGMSRLFHHDKESGVARAAEKFGATYCLSTLATTSMEAIAEETSTPKIFQIYILKDRELTREYVTRARASGYQALCLTVDTAVAGNRERDFVNGMRMPPKFSLSSMLSFLTHPQWGINFALKPEFSLANVEHRVDAIGGGTIGLVEYVDSQLDRSVTWEDAAWLVEQWDGPFIIKGISSPADAVRAREIGATAVMISNHGGRQLDTSPSPLEQLPKIRDAVGSDVELIVDGGIRRGTHVLKALALGADACSIGRSYLYGLAAGGQPGVERALNILKTEIERDMGLLGCRSIAEIDARHITAAGK